MPVPGNLLRILCFWFCLVILLESCIPSCLLAEELSPSLPAEPILAGWYINGFFLGNHLFVRQKDNTFLMPFELFEEKTGLKPYGTKNTDGSTTYNTSLGEMRFNGTSLQQVDEIAHISFIDLKEFFFSSAEFNNSTYAVEMFIPWRPGLKVSTKQNKPQGTPDRTPPAGSFSFVRIGGDSNFDLRNSEQQYYSLLESGGRVLDGVWNIQLTGNPEEELRPSSYHWTNFGEQWALRAGTGTASSYPLLTSSDLTGLQLAWSNSSIKPYLDREQYGNSDHFLSFDAGSGRDITGTGPAGGIAELRFDDTVISRERIPLNGRFNFRDVPVGTSFRKTEVYIYERSILDPPVQTLSFTRSIRNRSRPAEDLLLYSALGAGGNPLDDDRGSSSPDALAASMQVLYGLHDRVTLEGGWQHNPWTEQHEYLAGAILSLGEQWAASLYGAQANSQWGSEAALEGHGTSWDASWRGSRLGEGFRSNTSLQQQRHSTRISWHALQNFSLLLYGEYEKEGEESLRDFLLPGFTWRPVDRARLYVRPNSNGNYAYTTDYRFSPKSRIELEYEEKICTTELTHDFSSTLTMRQTNAWHVETDDVVSWLQIDWDPPSLPGNFFQISCAYSGNETGVRMQWRQEVNAGLEWVLGYSNNMGPASFLREKDDRPADEYGQWQEVDFTGEHLLTLSFTWDLGWTGKRLQPINRNTISTTRGGIAGYLQPADTDAFKTSDINDVSLLLDGRRISLDKQRAGTYFTGNLSPGIYALAINPELLPFGLVAEEKSILVEVAAGAITRADFPLYAQFGLMGQVVQADGAALAEHTVVVESQGEQTKSAATLTDRFGVYRIDGLRPGRYRVGVQLPQTGATEASVLYLEEIELKNSHLFDINLRIPSLQ
ncbi:MAG: carboxypeptidase regulatory-like domain-containing protein [bacterium]|nr:carboxypeptidase regulatory-like domain-containing protein [bacterium]